MKITHALALAAGMAMMSACSAGDDAAEEEGMTVQANTVVVDNVTDANLAMNMDANMDMNMDMNATTNVDANAAAGNTTNTY